MRKSPGEPPVLSQEGADAAREHRARNNPIVRRWDACRPRAVAYYEREQGVHERPIGETVLVHEVTHYGEMAHTIRHWVRGGQVCVSRDADRDLQLSNCLIALSTPGERYVLNDVHSSLVPRSHTDVHHSQVPAKSRDFAVQLLAEYDLPSLIERSPGYREIVEEVRGQLHGKVCSLIVWHRNVGEDNRDVYSDEHVSCEEGARLALGNIAREEVLHLGDKPDAIFRGMHLFGQHLRAADGERRPLLQQLQFIRAVVALSGARLIVSERSGLADLVALAGGIPVCQFIGRAVRGGNSRLAEVCESGCGMGHSVHLVGAKPAANVKLMTDACMAAIVNRIELCEALDELRRRLALPAQKTTAPIQECEKKGGDN